MMKKTGFQWEDIYNIDNGFMSLNTYGTKGSQGNRISSANSFATYLMYKYKTKGLTISPGLRYESIKLFRGMIMESQIHKETAMIFRQGKIKYQFLFPD